jgi:hypothetical protein
MKTLSNNNFKLASDFLKTHGRKLDYAMYQYFFEGRPSDQAILELESYQNSDGGFGKCLEPDFRLAESSPMATSVALGLAVDLGLDKNHQLVKNAMTYYQNTLDREFLYWFQTPKEIDLVPRAPWWSFDSSHGDKEGGDAWANPSAEILAQMIYFEGIDPSTLAKLCAKAEKELGNCGEPIEMHSLLCFLKLYNLSDFKNSKNWTDKLVNQSQKNITTTEKDWEGYGLRPHWVIDSPAHFLYSHFEDAIERSLDFEINAQTNEGAWYPFWSWGEPSPHWDQAKIEWASFLTLKMLRVLKNFNRIQE